MFRLEKYHGTKSRYVCPNCGARNSFVRYVKSETGEYISETVGRCNRESKCGYHLAPKEYFDQNPQRGNDYDFRLKKRNRKGAANYRFTEKTDFEPKPADTIEASVLQKTLRNYEANNFVRFLLNLFPEDRARVWQTVKDYLIGTTREGASVFWQIDERKRIRTGKIILYNAESGKRGKNLNWVHSVLKSCGKLKQDFNLRQCFFGEHLLIRETEKPLAIVEAEKTACVASVCFPEFVWLAAGAKQNLRPEKLQKFRWHQIVLYPDADAFDQWREIALKAQASGLNVAVSSLIETRASLEQKRSGYDLADYLIEEQTRINEHNAFADSYNRRLEKVLRDENLFSQFNRALDAQKADLITSNGLSEADAERQISDFGNMREIVFRITGEQNPT